MEEVQNQGATPEIATPTTDSAQEAKVEQPPQETRQDRNWRELSRRKDDLEIEVKMQRELIARLANQQTASTPVPPAEDILSDLSKEEYVPGEKVAKGFKAMEKNFEQKLEAIEKRHAAEKQASRYDRLRQRYQDLDDVVNPETLAIVKQRDPDLANVWSKLDDYSIAVQAYPYIKASGILDEVPGSRRAAEVDKKLEKQEAVKKATAQAPVPPPPQRTMAQAFLMKDPNRQALYREMTSYASRVGGSY